MPPSLKNVEQNATRPCADLVWIVLKFFHKISPVRCPLPAHLIKSVHIEKNSQSTKASYWSARGQTIRGQKYLGSFDMKLCRINNAVQNSITR